MKRKMVSLLLASLLAVGAFGCGNGGSTAGSSAAASSAAGSSAAASSSSAAKDSYVIATDTAFAPFEYEDSTGKRLGIDMDLMEAVAKD